MTKFSIVIPTRNRAHTLLYTLKTCINQQDFDDYEIVVSDNCSDDNTADVVKELNSDKIKYFRTETSLAMTDSWNFAISKAKGEYVMFVGSDDAVYSYALYTLNQIASVTGEKIICYSPDKYHWPDYVDPQEKNTFIAGGLSREPIILKVIDAKSRVRDVLDYKQPVYALPYLYTNGVVHREIIDTLKSKTGFVFDSLGPDTYFGFAVSALVKSYIAVSLPVNLYGMSGRSNYASYIYKVPKSESDDFFALNELAERKASAKFYENGIPSYNDLIIQNDFTAAKRNLNAFDDIDINCTKHIKAVINERYDFYKFKGTEGKIAFNEELKLIEKIINDDETLLSSFDGVGLDIEKYTFMSPEYTAAPRVAGRWLALDLSPMKIENISEAVTFAEKLLYPKKRVDFFLKTLKEDWEKVDCLLKKLRQYERIGIFATGGHTDALIKSYKHHGLDTAKICLFDNDEAKWGTICHGMEVLPPYLIPEQNLDALIISSYNFQDEIYDDLQQCSNDTEIIRLYGENGENLPKEHFNWFA